MFYNKTIQKCFRLILGHYFTMENLKKYDVEPILPMRSISDLAISPDGDRILFTRTNTDDKEDKYESHIWITSIETAEINQFTHGLGSDSNPIWSPDGKKIFFLSNRKVKGQEDNGMRLWAISAEGGEARMVTQAKYSIESPKLSPDGEQVLFLSNIEEDSEARGDSE